MELVSKASSVCDSPQGTSLLTAVVGSRTAVDNQGLVCKAYSAPPHPETCRALPQSISVGNCKYYKPITFSGVQFSDPCAIDLPFWQLRQPESHPFWLFCEGHFLTVHSEEYCNVTGGQCGVQATIRRLKLPTSKLNIPTAFRKQLDSCPIPRATVCRWNAGPVKCR